MPDYSVEKEIKAAGYSFVCGVDEAGRGPLAGPVCAAAVILPDGLYIEGLNDSKKISEKKREALFDVIKREAVTYAISFGSVEEIEEHNILQATFLAMNRAIDSLDTPADFAIIDGNRVPTNIKIPCKTVVKGDSVSCSVAAASVLAKVTRDRLMLEADEKWPEYAFAAHKGYGTKVHIEAIGKYGACPIHRMSFMEKFLK